MNAELRDHIRGHLATLPAVSRRVFPVAAGRASASSRAWLTLAVAIAFGRQATFRREEILTRWA